LRKYLIFIVISILFLGCAKKGDNRLIVGIIQPSLNHLPLNFGFESGALEKEAYIIKKFSSGWETNEALVAGKIDVAILPFTYIWNDVSRGKKVKIISFLERESDGIITSKELKDVSELDGKKIGVLRASTLDLFAEIFTEEMNISFEMVYLRTPMDMASALRKGEVDALSFYVPPILKFDEKEFHIIHWYSELFPLHTCCDIAATEQALNKKSGQIKRFLKGMVQSVDEMNNNPRVSYEAAREFYDLYYHIAKQSIQHTKFVMGLAEKDKLFEKRVFEIMLQKGYAENEIGVDKVYQQIQ
jgi:ABC-type nitrate/sulfonate/bicarbonate transport system substrate-binding protein